MPAYLAATGVTGISVADIAAQVASPDVKGAFGAILADAFGAAYADAINVHRPAMQALYEGYFNANSLDALMFPTTILPAVPIDLVNGSSQVSINGGPRWTNSRPTSETPMQAATQAFAACPCPQA
jgi:hypothetical protein